jgi:hypothetical protein
MSVTIRDDDAVSKEFYIYHKVTVRYKNDRYCSMSCLFLDIGIGTKCLLTNEKIQCENLPCKEAENGFSTEYVRSQCCKNYCRRCL